MTRLVPEVVVELHAGGISLPTAYDLEVLVKKEEPARSVPVRISQTRDHHVPVRQAVRAVGSAEVRLGSDLPGLYDLVHLGCALVLGIDDVDAARAEARQHQEAALLGRLAVAGAAGVPARVMQLITHVWHLQPVDHLRVRRRRGVYVDGRQVVWSVHAGADPQRGGVEDPLPRTVHGLARGSVARSAGVAQVVCMSMLAVHLYALSL